MAIEFHCPECGQFLKTSDDRAGLQARCPGCGETVEIPGSVEAGARSAERGARSAEAEAQNDESGSRKPEVGTWGEAGEGIQPQKSGAETKRCPLCGEEIKAAAILCRYCGAKFTTSAEARVIPVYAGFWLRVVASIVDAFVLFIPALLLGCLVGMLGGILRPLGFPRVLAEVGIPNVGGIVIGWLYFALMESSASQATLGKQAVGIFVTDGARGRISFARATGRHFAKFVSYFTLLIGFLMAGFTPKKQALHDMIADTLVLRRR